MSQLRNNPLLVIFFTVFVDLLGIGILIPVIPQLLANPRSEYFLLQPGQTLQYGYIMLGFLTAAYPLAQFFAAPILGQLSDYYGRKKVLAFSLAGTSLSYILFAIGIITKNIPLLFFARILDGITGGNIAVAQAAIADVTTPENRAKNFGLIGAAFGLGFILGPYIGGKLSDPNVVSWFSAPIPFWFAAIISALNVIFVLFLFPETLHHVAERFQISWDKSIRNIIKAFSFKDLRVLFTTVFLFTAGFTFFTTFFGVFLISKFRFTQGNIGDFFAFVGIWIALTQAVVTRKLAAKYTEFQILQISLMATGLFILAYYLPTKSWQLFLIVPFFAIFNGLAQANIVGLISRSVNPKIQGEILGINASVQALGQAIPPMISGYVAAKLSPDTPLLVSALVIVLAGYIFLIFYRPNTEKKEELNGSITITP